MRTFVFVSWARRIFRNDKRQAIRPPHLARAGALHCLRETNSHRSGDGCIWLDEMVPPLAAGPDPLEYGRIGHKPGLAELAYQFWRELTVAIRRYEATGPNQGFKDRFGASVHTCATS